MFFQHVHQHAPRTEQKEIRISRVYPWRQNWINFLKSAYFEYILGSVNMFSLIAKCQPCVIVISCETFGDIVADKGSATTLREIPTWSLLLIALRFCYRRKNGINKFIFNNTHHAWHHREIHPRLRPLSAQFINWRNFAWYETGTTTSHSAPDQFISA